MRIVMDRFAREKGASIPRGYGYSYTLADRDAVVYYPIPINYIVRYWRRCYWRLMKNLYWVGLIDVGMGECFYWSSFWRIKSH